MIYFLCFLFDHLYRSCFIFFNLFNDFFSFYYFLHLWNFCMVCFEVVGNYSFLSLTFYCIWSRLFNLLFFLYFNFLIVFFFFYLFCLSDWLWMHFERSNDSARRRRLYADLLGDRRLRWKVWNHYFLLDNLLRVDYFQFCNQRLQLAISIL